MIPIRIGHGIDVHRFADQAAEDASVILGGVTIAHDRSLLAHSDGDVLTHALMDALLGALALGDIGKHFPDSDPRYKDANSQVLLQHVYKLVTDKGWRLGNADITVVAQSPRLSPHIDTIRSALANTLTVITEDIAVKATTSESLGFTGRGEGIAVFATVLLCRD